MWSESRSVVSDSLWSNELQPTRLLCPWNSPGKITGVGGCSFLQGIFLTQGLNPGLPHCRRILCCLSHKVSPMHYIIYMFYIFIHTNNRLIYRKLCYTLCGTLCSVCILYTHCACVCAQPLSTHRGVCDSLWPQGLQPARLLCPWGSPGKITGVGFYAILQRIFTQGLNPHLFHLLHRQVALYH